MGRCYNGALRVSSWAVESLASCERCCVRSAKGGRGYARGDGVLLRAAPREDFEDLHCDLAYAGVVVREGGEGERRQETDEHERGRGQRELIHAEDGRSGFT